MVIRGVKLGKLGSSSVRSCDPIRQIGAHRDADIPTQAYSESVFFFLPKHKCLTACRDSNPSPLRTSFLPTTDTQFE